MPVLSNPKHEKFAQLVAAGAGPTDAYRGAGYSGHSSSASRLLVDASVADRVAELRDAGAERAEMDVEGALRRMHHLSTTAEALGDVPTAVVAHRELCKMLGAYNEGGGSAPKALPERLARVVEMLDITEIREAKRRQLASGGD